jgi:hypothetical protein
LVGTRFVFLFGTAFVGAGRFFFGARFVGSGRFLFGARFVGATCFVFRFGFAPLTGFAGATGFPFVFVARLFGRGAATDFGTTYVFTLGSHLFIKCSSTPIDERRVLPPAVARHTRTSVRCYFTGTTSTINSARFELLPKADEGRVDEQNRQDDDGSRDATTPHDSGTAAGHRDRVA